MNDLSATDRCVKCGLCLPHCPTFALTGNEADSPRGRISLMQALDRPDLQWSPGLFRHLDQCLQCGACEAMCPSRVPFIQLMDSARARIEPHRQRSSGNRLMRVTGLWLISSPVRTKILAGVLKSYQRFGFQKLLSPLLPAGLRRLSRTIPDIHDQRDITTTPVDAGRDNVNLFLGCTGELFGRTTLASSKRLLERLGYRVNIPARQTCCGAVHQHNGDPETAGQLAQTNHRVFGADNNPILVTASGCTAHLLSDNALAGRVSDILDFLLRQPSKKLKLQPFAEKVALYVPCTHRNSLKQQQTIVDILKLIPGLQPLLINPQGGCCGAAGSYMLSQPELSDRLRAPVIEKLAESGANVLLTTNIGCSIHLQVGLKERGLEIDVLHPVVLLDRLLVAENGDV